ncbi:ribosome small subunit-dependent GTPase A [Stagnihabitans tardus]|uniref:Small ribosomal subunit biogenesis GTPase RsgA n=1 Tax=Stagnihabitans tardus TaxID=2699202 RepID=A0AAE4Y7P0_9RHOB|nr:ribosome small subunit-dependent GTPase A [Stagnihabitans tardus]NBZ86702.1 ribosome small subunit-dependent GTPase A [Stagnihabitans tardus]
MTFDLNALGWGEDFAAQGGAGRPLRVTSVHRARLMGLGPEGAVELIPHSSLSTGDIAVGDWVMAEGMVALQVLDRRSLVQRKAAGTGLARQLIAANLDVLFVVSSCNADFNPGRMERFLVLAAQAGVTPVVVLTKADQCDDPEVFRRQALALARQIAVVVLDAKRGDVGSALAPWCGPGRTVALLGSSGVGKTTIANALTGGQAAVQDIRDDDAKGRHTTTGRYLVAMRGGGWLIDTPGMREIQLTDAAEGIDILFEDLAELATECKFTNCRHASEPGCAVQAAVRAGEILPERVSRWQKLVAEAEENAVKLSRSRKAPGKGRRR